MIISDSNKFFKIIIHLQTIYLQGLQDEVHKVLQPERSHEEAHEREALQVLHMCKGLQKEGPFEGSRVSHWLMVWKMFHFDKHYFSFIIVKKLLIMEERENILYKFKTSLKNNHNYFIIL